MIRHRLEIKRDCTARSTNIGCGISVQERLSDGL